MTTDPNAIIKMLDWLYERAINGVPGTVSAEDLGEDFLKGEGSLHDKVNRLIRWQTAKSATTGFVSGLGGVMTLPVTLPANITVVFFIQLRMIAAIAHMAGYDVKDDRVKTLCYVCLAGNAAKDVLKAVGIQAGSKVTKVAVEKISFEVIKAINQKVGFRLVTKFGETGVVNLGKAIPLVGGVIGGTFDGTATLTAGHTARNTFLGTPRNGGVSESTNE